MRPIPGGREVDSFYLPLHGTGAVRHFEPRHPDDVHADDILARSVIIFCAFIPLFSFLELRRVLGEGNFHDLLFRSRAKSALISRQSNEK